ncbi:hypothetical protein [Algoriphagus taiwanensis]|uniref:DUF2947 domain-containing protein n=1 Tax=Algoriphagus taiwanensis TaxID=1445656 RepID=A0ABQ6Q365_9BACT|nr:hypothetical protein Ataiwa_28950 [Algoriphagus taiwanensis]
MTIDFSNIHDHVIEIEDFDLKWRFTEEKYAILPESDLKQIKPLDKEAGKYLDHFIRSVELHADEPFKENFFSQIESIPVSDGNELEIQKWLTERGLPFEKMVYVSWDSQNGAIVSWEILIKYFDDFYYPGSDDLSVFDENLNWALVFAHWEKIYFGTKDEFKRVENKL